eukprot:1049364-Amphidinium_carterae.1
MREWQRHPLVQSAGAEGAMPHAAGAVSPGQVAQIFSADADVDMPQAAGAASSSLHSANAAPLATALGGTLLDESQSASAAPTLSQTA